MYNYKTTKKTVNALDEHFKEAFASFDIWNGLFWPTEYSKIDDNNNDEYIWTEESLNFKIDVPGFCKDTLNVNITDGKLSITGNTELDCSFPARKIQRLIKLPVSKLNIHSTVSKLKNGMLYVTIPRKNPSNDSGGTIKVEIK